MDRPKIVKRTTIEEASIINLVRLDVRYPDGVIRPRDCVEHRGAVVILPCLEAGVLLVRQYRPAVDAELLELPAGLIEPGEEPVATASRELLEETGFKAGKMSYVTTYFTTPGYSTERLVFYRGEELTKTDWEIEPGLTLAVLSRNDVERHLERGSIQDAKTLIGLLFYLKRG